MHKPILLLLGLFFSFSLQATEPANCVSRADADWAKSHFTFTTQDPNLSFELCTESIYTNTLRGLLFLRDFPKQDWTADDFQKNIFGSDPFAFLKANIQRLEFLPASDTDRCPPGAFMGVHPDDRTAIRICPVKELNPLIFSSAILHEARHSTSGYGHANCLYGRQSEGITCDLSLDFAGGYAVGVELYVKASRTSSFDSALRQQARALAITDLLERFQTPPLAIDRGYLLQTESGEVIFWGARGSRPFFSAPRPSALLIHRFASQALFDRDTGNVTDCFSASACLADAAGMIAAEFRSLGSAAKRASLLDVTYEAGGRVDYSCLLYSDTVDCIQSDGQDRVSVDIRALGPKKFLYAGNTGWLPNENALYIVDAQGFAYQMPATFAALKQGQAGSLVKQETQIGLLEVTRVSRDREMAIFLNGDLMYYDIVKGQWDPVPQMRGQKFRRFLSDVLWSPRVEEL